MERMNGGIDSNTNNTKEDQNIIIDNSHELTIKTSDNDELVLVNVPLRKTLIHLQVFRTKGVVTT